MNTILEIEGLTKYFTEKDKSKYTAVDHVGFRLEEGETLGLVGESGCGKTTLVKLITRLMEPASGTICLGGKDITKARGKELREAYRQMQMVFQFPMGSFDPRKTIGYSIEESMKNHGIYKEERGRRVRELLEQCGLSFQYAKRYPREISGGQCQRAAIARALAIQPRLLICDEATSSLDATVQYQIMELLQELKQKKNLSFLFICHNLALVQSFCDRVLVMYKGKIVEEGPPDQVIRRPRSEYTKCLVDAAQSYMYGGADPSAWRFKV